MFKIRPAHVPVDLSNHQGILLNSDFGFSPTSHSSPPLDLAIEADVHIIVRRIETLERSHRRLKASFLALAVAAAVLNLL